ncbi:MAG: T9SS type A sorting domain-containing protein [Bacteroidota bacterium]
MKKYLLLLCFLFVYDISYSQIEGCDGIRFRDDVFSTVGVFNDIKFGEGETFAGNFQELFLNVYEPIGDNLEKRPVIILAFGGSFIGGERSDVGFLCEAYAKKGYVAVAIDYRLYDGPLVPIPSDDDFKVVVIKSVSDMKAAIRFMRQDADTNNQFRIDPDNIFVGGVSAGSITAFHTAVLDETDDLPEDIMTILDDNGGIEGNSSSNLEYSSEVQGLVNFSGGLNNASWIDANDPPFVSIHDDMDPVVPYGGGFATVFNIPIIFMEGSQRCQEVGDSVSVLNQLRTIENSQGHVSFLFGADNVVSSVDFTADFLANILCGDLTSSVADFSERLESVHSYPNPSAGLVTISNPFNLKLEYSIFDMYGRIVTIPTQNPTLDLSNLSNGMYFLKLVDLDTRETKTEKFILEK